MYCTNAMTTKNFLTVDNVFVLDMIWIWCTKSWSHKQDQRHCDLAKQCSHPCHSCHLLSHPHHQVNIHPCIIFEYTVILAIRIIFILHLQCHPTHQDNIHPCHYFHHAVILTIRLIFILASFSSSSPSGYIHPFHFNHPYRHPLFTYDWDHVILFIVILTMMLLFIPVIFIIYTDIAQSNDWHRGTHWVSSALSLIGGLHIDARALLDL